MLLAANKTKNSMNIEEAREYCLSLKNVTECFPFDDVSLVFKVEGKMFLLLPLDAVEPCVSLKCSTDYVEDLRERYTAVEGAWHFNKKYWNTIYLDRDMPDSEIAKALNMVRSSVAYRRSATLKLLKELMGGKADGQ